MRANHKQHSIMPFTLQMEVDEYKPFPTGSATYKGNTSGKQGDWGVKPVPERERETDWPTLVIECGISIPTGD